MGDGEGRLLVFPKINSPPPNAEEDWERDEREREREGAVSKMRRSHKGPIDIAYGEIHTRCPPSNIVDSLTQTWLRSRTEQPLEVVRGDVASNI